MKRTTEDTPYMDTYNKASTPAGYRFPGAPYVIKPGMAPGAVQTVPVEESTKGKKKKK